MKTFIDVVKTNNYERLRSTAGILGNKFIYEMLESIYFINYKMDFPTILCHKIMNDILYK